MRRLACISVTQASSDSLWSESVVEVPWFSIFCIFSKTEMLDCLFSGGLGGCYIFLEQPNLVKLRG